MKRFDKKTEGAEAPNTKINTSSVDLPGEKRNLGEAQIEQIIRQMRTSTDDALKQIAEKFGISVSQVLQILEKREQENSQESSLMFQNNGITGLLKLSKNDYRVVKTQNESNVSYLMADNDNAAIAIAQSLGAFNGTTGLLLTMCLCELTKNNAFRQTNKQSDQSSPT